MAQETGTAMGATDENGGTGKCVFVCVLREEGTRRAEGGGVLAIRRIINSVVVRRGKMIKGMGFFFFAKFP